MLYLPILVMWSLNAILRMSAFEMSSTSRKTELQGSPVNVALTAASGDASIGATLVQEER